MNSPIQTGEMKMKTRSHMTSVAVAILALVFAGDLLAGSCSNRGCNSRIKKIYPSANGLTYFELKDVSPYGANCTPVEGKLWTLYPDHANHSQYVMMTHLAAEVGAILYFRIVEGSSDCEINYITRTY